MAIKDPGVVRTGTEHGSRARFAPRGASSSLPGLSLGRDAQRASPGRCHRYRGQNEPRAPRQRR